MCSPQSVLSTLAVKMAEILIQPVTRQIGYLIHYKKNLRNLEAQMIDLREQRGKIEGDVEEKKTLGEIIVDDVKNWLTEVDNREKDVEGFKKTTTVKENMQCFKCSCPDFIWRYRLSKEAEEKTTAVKALVEKSNFQAVSRPKPPPQELQFVLCEDYETFDSRASVFKEIMEALKDSTGSIIGIFGTGGVGKTTMVEEISKKVQEDGLFDEVVMAVVSQNANVTQIQEQLADRLRVKLNAATEGGKACQIWNRLKNGKTNLVILDDVWQEVKLKTIGIPITDGGSGCKVVLTSRDQDVCQSMKAEKAFQIQALSKPEAWVLFKKQVGNSFDTPEMECIANAVCEECGGLPVAILAVGAALKDKEKYAWEDCLDKLRKSMLKSIDKRIEERVFSLLKLSYDYITLEEAKSCFLLCSLFQEDAEILIEDLVRYAVGRSLLENVDTLEKARNRVFMLVDTLKTSCLLSSYGKYSVKMHDVIRDVAISIAKDDKAFLVKHGVQEWPEQGTFERCSAISLRSKYIHELPHDLVCPQLHTLVLECTNPSLKVPESFFHGMEELNVLDMIDMRISPLPSSFRYLVNLRTLSLYRCKLTDTAVLKELKNLEVLSLRRSDIEELSPEMRQLTRLRSLDLQLCDSLRIIPPNIISSLSRLEELFISYRFDRWEVAEPTTNEGGTNASLAELNSLTRLTALEIHIPKGMSLPKDQILERLVRFKISVGDIFYYLRPYYSSKTVLKVDSISLKNEINILLAKAEVLHLKGCQGLKKVLHDGEGKRFFEMKEMRFENIDGLEHLFGKQRGYLQTLRPQQQSALFSKLSKLEVIDCKLKYLFSLSIARELAVLESLTVEGCESMEEIVGNESGGGDDHEEITDNVVIFHKLRWMDLKRLPNLRSFYRTKKKKKSTTTNEGSHLITAEAEPLFNEKVALPTLNKLNIDGVPNITEIWDKELLSEKEAESFRQLRIVYVWNCDELVNVASSKMLSRLLKLESLSVRGCPKMEVIIVLEKEKEKETANDDIVVLPQLRTLSIVNLQNLKSFCSRTTRSKAQPLFNHQVSFPALEELHINDMTNIMEIWDEKLLSEKESESFYQLKILKILSCGKLKYLIPSNMLPRLQNLKELLVSNSPQVEMIVSKKAKEKEATGDDIIILFPQLRTLLLEELHNLKSFCSSTSGSSEGRPLFDHQVALPTLNKLHIDGVPNITEIWDKELLLEKEAESFCQLRDVCVWNCDELVNVASSKMLSRLLKLEDLSISECPKMEVIIVMEKEKEKETANDDDIVVLPQLRTLEIERLHNLKSFCSRTTRSEAQPLFNHQVAFPKLEELSVIECANSAEIHLCPLLPQRFQNLGKLIVRNCDGVRKVFHLEGEEGLNVVGDLGQHVGQCITKVRMMELDSLPQLTCLWNYKDDPHLILGFRNLKYLVIKNCSLLRNLFTSSVAMALEQLEILYLESCTMMEEVVIATTDNKGQKEVSTDDDHEIAFLKLEWLILKNLPNLQSFCSNENYNFNLPSLKKVVLKRCPKMQTFASGGLVVRMPQTTFVSTRGNEGLHIKDLNEYLKQRSLAGEECAMMDDNDYAGEEQQFSKLY